MEGLPMRRLGAFAVLLLTMCGTARASHRCTLDLTTLISVHSNVGIQVEPENAPWPPPFQTVSDLLVSKGGAATLMRTDTASEAASVRTFLSGRLPNQLLAQLQAAVSNVGSAPGPDCYVLSDPDPPTGEFTRGTRFITFYDRFSTSLLRVQHADPDNTFLPMCEEPVEALVRTIETVEKTFLKGDIRPLQCSAR
jgi:hypothetical protein